MSRVLPAPHPSPRGPRRGVALLVALGVLVVLALLGAVFATLTGIERSVARNYIDKVRARVLAESGIEDAFARVGVDHARALDLWRATEPQPWMFFGFDLNGNGLVDAGETATYAIPLPGGGTAHDWGRVTLEEAVRPSFPFDRNGNGAFDVPADLVTIEGRPTAISGRLDVGTYAPEGNVYALKIGDLQGRINVNNRHTHLARILNTLGRRLSVSATLGDTIVAFRDNLLPDRRLTNLDQLVAPLGRTTVERIRPYITTDSWVDYKVIKPIGLAAGRRRRDVGVGSSFYAYREIRPREILGPPPDPDAYLPPTGPATATDFEGRSPINVNTASFEVLAALLEGLQGFYIKETPGVESDDYQLSRTTLTFTGNDPRTSGQIGIVYQTPPIGPNTAANIAAEFVRYRGVFPTGTVTGPVDPRTVFRSYQQLARFIDLLPASVFDAGEIPADQILYVRDVLKANFDPNCHLNELNPDEAVALKVDKTDLLFWTFELCFIPMGYFEIESLGRVIDGQGREIASEKLVVQAKLFDVFRDTTQADFQRDLYLDDANRALDLPPAPAESELRKMFSASSATTAYPKCGHLAVGPEPYYQPQYVQRSWYDGYVSLLPIESLPGGGRASLKARFETSLLQEGGGPVPTPDPGGGPWLEPLVGSANPGSLFADGLFAEKDVSVGYDNRMYFNQHCGATCFWLKPAFEPEHPGKTRFFVSLITYDLSNDVRNDWTANPFCVGYLPHDLSTRREDYPTYKYASGWGDYFANSIIGGYAGAYRRVMGDGVSLTNGVWQKTWMTQDLIDVSTYTGDHGGYPVGCMCDRISLNGSPTVNHVGHGHEFLVSADGKPWGNLMLQGRWVHVGMIWNDTISNAGIVKIMVNGTSVPWLCTYGDMTGQNLSSVPYRNLNMLWGPPFGLVNPQRMQIAATDPPSCYGLPPDGPPYPTKLFNGQPEPPDFRVGAVCATPIRSAWAVARSGGAGQRYVSNFPADATIDEVMTFLGSNEEATTSILDAWREGRFYKSTGTPDKSTTSSGTLARFTSGRVRFSQAVTRPTSIPPKGNAPSPAVVTPPQPPTGAATASPDSVRLGLVFYTLRVPRYDLVTLAYPSGLPSGTVPDPRVYFDVVDADTNVSLLDASAVLGYSDPSMTYFLLGGGGIAKDGRAGGPPVDVAAGKEIRYRFWLDTRIGDAMNDPFSATPVVDDVTITYARTRPVILSWTVAN